MTDSTGRGRRTKRSSRRYVDVLIERAERTIPSGPGAPSQAELSRSVSDAYYAVFHYVTDQVAVHLMGSSTTAECRAARNLLARSVTHTSLSNALRKLSSGPFAGRLVDGLSKQQGRLPECPPETVDFSLILMNLQKLRYAGDYDWNQVLTKREAIDAVEDARRAVELFDAIPAGDLGRRWFLSVLVCWPGLKDR